MATAPTFTILLCINRAPALLPFAVASVRAQTRPDFELLILCDGAPEATAAAAAALAAEDRRIRVLVHPKGERSGERWRHQALADAQGHLVAMIADDDLWFPDHLAELAVLLAETDFGNVVAALVDGSGRITSLFDDLADPLTRQRMRSEAFNFFGPTAVGYRLDAYRRLPFGWQPAPADVWPDLHMWRQFLAVDELRVGTRFAITTLGLPTSLRPGRSLAERQRETAAWAKLVADADGRDRLRQAVMGDWRRRLSQLPPMLAHTACERDQARAEIARLQGELAAEVARRDACITALAAAEASVQAAQPPLAEYPRRLAAVEAERDRLADRVAKLKRSPIRRALRPVRRLARPFRGA